MLKYKNRIIIVLAFTREVFASGIAPRYRGFFNLKLKFMNEKKIIAARKMLINYLSDLRKEKKITLEQISEITGIEQPHISRFFNSEISPTLDTFIKISDAIKCYIAVLPINF